MDPTQYVKYLQKRATTCFFQSVSIHSTENNVRFLSVSFESLDSLQAKKKIFQNLQTPEFRFISIEQLTSISSVSMGFLPIPTPNRCLVRFKIS